MGATGFPVRWWLAGVLQASIVAGYLHLLHSTFLAHDSEAIWHVRGAWGPAWVLGAALAPTDATAVGVLARNLPRRTVTVLRAESLVNDGTPWSSTASRSGSPWGSRTSPGGT